MLRNLWRRLNPRPAETAAKPPRDAALAELRLELPRCRSLNEQDWQRLALAATQLERRWAWEGAQGLTLTAAMRARVSLLAAWPVIELGLHWLDRVPGVILYPDAFVVPVEEMDEYGVVHVYEDVRAGEAWGHGLLVLSWADVAASGQRQGFDVVAHEIAHVLDARGGCGPGCPPLPPGIQPEQWRQVTLRTQQQVATAHRLDGAEADDSPVLEVEAAEDPAELFAYASEWFFDAPEALRARHPDYFRLLQGFYEPESARNGQNERHAGG